MRWNIRKRCQECGRVYDGMECPECGCYATTYEIPEEFEEPEELKELFDSDDDDVEDDE